MSLNLNNYNISIQDIYKVLEMRSLYYQDIACVFMFILAKAYSFVSFQNLLKWKCQLFYVSLFMKVIIMEMSLIQGYTIVMFFFKKNI